MMGGKSYNVVDSPITQTQVNDPNDPRSPSLKRTPICTPVVSWRQKAELARAKAMENDPRSPGLMRTPLQDQQPALTEPVTPLTLSYEDCTKPNPEDPRSPLSFRTPLSYAQGIKYDTSSVISCGPFDDTVVITPSNTTEDTQDCDVTVTASSIINNPLADLSIISSSTEIQTADTTSEDVTSQGVDKPKKPIEESSNDIEVPSSPLGASACKLDEEEKLIEKVSVPEVIPASPLLAERKRKNYPTKQNLHQGVSPLKKSFSSPCVVENDENNPNTHSPLITRKTTPNTPRRGTNNEKGSNSPTTTRKTTPNKRTPTSTPTSSRRMSTTLKNSGPAQRAPLSPITLHSKRSSDSLASSGNFLL